MNAVNFTKFAKLYPLETYPVYSIPCLYMYIIYVHSNTMYVSTVHIFDYVLIVLNICTCIHLYLFACVLLCQQFYSIAIMSTVEPL